MLKLWNRPRDFERSVEPHLAVLYRVSRRLAGDPERAEDLVQQCLLRAFQAWPRFDGRFIRSWLIRILRNEFYAGQEAALRVGREVVLDSYEPAEDCLWNELIWRDQAARILEEVDRLPEDHRLAVQLCDVEEMTYMEAAEALDLPIGTLKSRLFRARATIRQRLTSKLELGVGQ